MTKSATRIRVVILLQKFVPLPNEDLTSRWARCWHVARWLCRTERLLERAGECGFGIVADNLSNLREGHAGIAELVVAICMRQLAR